MEEKGKMLGHPGKERKEGEEGVQPSNTAEGTRGAAAARGRSSERARRRGVERCMSGEKRREREREDAWATPGTCGSAEEKEKWAGPKGTGGFLIYSNKFQLAQNVLIIGWTYQALKIPNKIWLE
jgi:hypothetical protein